MSVCPHYQQFKKKPALVHHEIADNKVKISVYEKQPTFPGE